MVELCTTELEQLADTLSDEEIERTKEQIKGQIVLSMESPSARMNRLGRSVLMGLEIRTLDGMLAQVDAVDRDAVIALAREFYDVGTWSAVCIGPDPEPFQATVSGYKWWDPE